MTLEAGSCFLLKPLALSFSQGQSGVCVSPLVSLQSPLSVDHLVPGVRQPFEGQTDREPSNPACSTWSLQFFNYLSVSHSPHVPDQL